MYVLGDETGWKLMKKARLWNAVSISELMHDFMLEDVGSMKLYEKWRRLKSLSKDLYETDDIPRKKFVMFFYNRRVSMMEEC